MMNKKGFTLVELMVVIVIIGVLAAVAIPKFSAATNKAKASECPTVMSQIVSAQEVFETETNAYATAADHATLKTQIGVDASKSRYFAYSTYGGANFTAFAQVAEDFGEATTTADYVAVDDAGEVGVTATMLEYLRSFANSDIGGAPKTLSDGTAPTTYTSMAN